MQPLLTQLLNLDGVEVEDYRDLGEEIVLEVKAARDWAICPRCAQTSHNVHQSHFHLARDLSISNRQVSLKFIKARGTVNREAEYKIERGQTSLSKVG